MARCLKDCDARIATIIGRTGPTSVSANPSIGAPIAPPAVPSPGTLGPNSVLQRFVGGNAACNGYLSRLDNSYLDGLLEAHAQLIPLVVVVRVPEQVDVVEGFAGECSSVVMSRRRRRISRTPDSVR